MGKTTFISEAARRKEAKDRKENSSRGMFDFSGSNLNKQVFFLSLCRPSQWLLSLGFHTPAAHPPSCTCISSGCRPRFPVKGQILRAGVGNGWGGGGFALKRQTGRPRLFELQASARFSPALTSEYQRRQRWRRQIPPPGGFTWLLQRRLFFLKKHFA